MKVSSSPVTTATSARSLAPFLAAAGHEVVGLDTFFYRGCDLRRPGRAAVDRRRSTPTCATSTVDELDGLDAVVHLAALSNDPLGDLDPDADLRDQPPRQRSPGARRARGRGQPLRLLVVVQHVRRRRGGAMLDEDAPLQPRHALRRVQGPRRGRDIAPARRRRFSPVFLRNATAYGVSPRLRCDVVLNNLVAWAHTTGQSASSERRHAVAADHPHRGHLAGRRARARGAARAGRRRGVQRRLDGGELPGARPRRDRPRDAFPARETEYGERSDPDPRSYRVDFGKLERPLPELKLEWNARYGAGELYEGYREAGLTFEQFEGPLFTRLKRLQQLRGEGALDDDLRWSA